MDLDDIKNLVVIGYTLWKWRKEMTKKNKRPQTERDKRQSAKRSK